MQVAVGSGGSPHRGRPAAHRTVQHATLLAFHPRPMNRPIPSKYRPKSKSVKFPTVKPPPGVKKHIPSARVTVPHAPSGPVSPYVNPFRYGRVTGARIDQGVDYSAAPGTPIAAIGAGRINAATATGSGWPGGGFIGELLTGKGPLKGQEIYVAEDVTPAVKAGQSVKAGQVIGYFAPGSSIEYGYGTYPAVGQAQAYGIQSAPGPDPGARTTAYGAAIDRVVRQLGGPAGVPQGPVFGTVPANLSSVGGRVPGQHHISLPPAVPAITVPHGVNPPSTVPPDGVFRLTSDVFPSPPGAGRLFPRPHRHHVPDPQPRRLPPVITPVAGGRGHHLGPRVKVKSKLVKIPGGFAAPAPGQGGGSNSAGLLLLLGGGALVVFLLLRKKGKKGGKK